MDVFDALADPVRRDLLVRMADAPRSVTDLMEGQTISRPAISRHLRVLRETGLVTVTSSGRHRLHELDRDALTPVGELLRTLKEPTPPLTEQQFDALDLGIRRTVRERRGAGAPISSQRGGRMMTSTREPTGQRDTRDPGWIVFTRRFAAPIDDVWAAVTEPDRMARWIGTWTGDPASGRVEFFMTAEGDDVVAETYVIETCDPPHGLVATSTDADGQSWRLRLELVETDETTTLRFGQLLTDPDVAASVGPGWEYYLDRLAAAETGGDLSSIDFDDYYPALSDHYRRLVS